MIKQLLLSILILAAGFGLSADALAQNPPSPAKQAVEVRQSIYKLINASFRPLVEIVKGQKAYDAADVQKRLSRITFLAGMLDDAYPDLSNVGEPDSKAKAEIWSNRADFDKKLKDMQDRAGALEKINATERTGGEGFKSAVIALADSCKACHETYRAK